MCYSNVFLKSIRVHIVVHTFTSFCIMYMLILAKLAIHFPDQSDMQIIEIKESTVHGCIAGMLYIIRVIRLCIGWLGFYPNNE